MLAEQADDLFIFPADSTFSIGREGTMTANRAMDDAGLAASAASLFGAWTSSSGVLTEREDSFLRVPVPPWSCRRLHTEVLAQLQTPARAKLLDLTHVQTVDAE